MMLRTKQPSKNDNKNNGDLDQIPNNTIGCQETKTFGIHP